MLIKRTGSNLVKNNPKSFTTSFDENKKVLDGLAEIPSKKLRNVIAGYVTSLVKQDRKRHPKAE